MLALFFIYGLFIGSFLNVCIYRIPEGISVINPPSTCGSCGHRLNYIDMIPVLNYVINKGRCRYCNDSYSVQYPLVELLNAILYLFIGMKYGMSFYSLIYCILISLMIVISFIDLKYMIIPDKLIAALMLMGAVVIMYDRTMILDKIIGSLMGFGMFLLIAIITNAMGGGDIKLIAALGLMFGIKGTLFIAVFSFLIGAVVCVLLLSLKMKNRKDKIPFGPFICLAALLYVFYGAEIINYYVNCLK